MTAHVHELLQDSHMFSDLTMYRGENICLSFFLQPELWYLLIIIAVDDIIKHR